MAYVSQDMKKETWRRRLACFFGIHDHVKVDCPPFTTEWRCSRCGKWYVKG